jgi:hypothetical protein
MSGTAAVSAGFQLQAQFSHLSRAVKIATRSSLAVCLAGWPSGKWKQHLLLCVISAPHGGKVCLCSIATLTANNNSVRLLKKLQEFGSLNLLRNFPEFFQEFSGIFFGKDPARIHTTNML